MWPGRNVLSTIKEARYFSVIQRSMDLLIVLSVGLDLSSSLELMD